jgi:hypothetical protein
MIISLRKLVKGAKLVFVFLLLTYCLYQGMSIVREWIRPADRYREPSGRAVKVFREEAVWEEGFTLGERLKRFYWYGE